MNELTHDELNLLCIYSNGSRTDAIHRLQDMKAYLEADELELLDMTNSVLNKLDAMTDAEYNALDLIPDFEE